MKIVSYNISTSKQWKIDQLLQMDADIFVVPEIARPSDVTLPEGYDMLWEGVDWEYNNETKSKGLGIIYKTSRAYLPVWYKRKPHYYALPIVCDDLLILGFWPTKHPADEKKKSYPQIAREIIEDYAPFFEGRKVLIIGDYNLYKGQKDGGAKHGDIVEINNLLNDLGLFSVYHAQSGEELGEETQPTFFHYYHKDKPFFLDYAYTNATVKSFSLLPWDEKMSDHVGQVLEVSSGKPTEEQRDIDQFLPPCRECTAKYVCDSTCKELDDWKYEMLTDQEKRKMKLDLVDSAIAWLSESVEKMNPLRQKMEADESERIENMKKNIQEILKNLE